MKVEFCLIAANDSYHRAILVCSAKDQHWLILAINSDGTFYRYGRISRTLGIALDKKGRVKLLNPENNKTHYHSKVKQEVRISLISWDVLPEINITLVNREYDFVWHILRLTPMGLYRPNGVSGPGTGLQLNTDYQIIEA